MNKLKNFFKNKNNYLSYKIYDKRNPQEFKALITLIKYMKKNNIENYQLDIRKINKHKYKVDVIETDEKKLNDDKWHTGYSTDMTFYI